MTRSTAPTLPLSPTHAAGLAHVAELRAAAERHTLVRAARPRRRATTWPPRVAAALRDSLTAALPSGRETGTRQTCATC
jgi:hypothetical protein